jgi:heptosyltransferase-2
LNRAGFDMSENAMKEGKSSVNGMKVVVRIPNWVGDAVMATPALRSIRMGFPNARIALQGRPKILDLLRGLKFFDELIPMTPGPRGGKAGILEAAAALRSRRFDMGLLLPNSFSSALIFFLGRVRARTGYAINGRGILLNRSLPLSARARKKDPSPMTGYFLKIARFAGGAPTSEEVELAALRESEERAEAFLKETGLAGARPLVGLNAGSSFGPSKCWTPEGFAAVADWAAGPLGGRAVLLCGPGEEETAKAVLAGTKSQLVDTSRRILPLDVLKSVMRRLDLLVTTDTGPRHIAVAFKVPVVVLMGPTNPAYTASNLDGTRVLRLDLDCAPCHKKDCDLDHACMRDITPAMVIEQAAGLLGRSPAEVLSHDS